MIKLTIRVISLGDAFSKAHIKLLWTTNHLSRITYKIYRSEKSDETGILVNTLIGDSGDQEHFWDDTDIDLGNRNKRYYYVVKGYLDSGELREETDPISWDDNYRIFEIHVLSLHEYYYRNQAGMPYYHYQRKVLNGSEKHCPVCWNIALHRPVIKTEKECSLCYNTGIINPYYDGVVIFASDQAPKNSTQELQNTGRVLDFDSIRLYTGGIPIIKHGDLLCDSVTRDFYQVDAINTIGRRHAPVMQILAVKKTPASKSEYKWITQDTEALDALDKEVRSINAERRF